MIWECLSKGHSMSRVNESIHMMPDTDTTMPTYHRGPLRPLNSRNVTTVRPARAFKVLAALMYCRDVRIITPETNEIIKIVSVWRLSEMLCVSSKNINEALDWLQLQGYITYMVRSENRRQVWVRVRRPTNMRT